MLYDLERCMQVGYAKRTCVGSQDVKKIVPAKLAAGRHATLTEGYRGYIGVI